MGGWSLSRSYARRRSIERRRAVADGLWTVTGLVALAAFVWLWLVVVTSPGPTLEAAALACARASDRTDGAIAQCYTVRGLPCRATSEAPLWHLQPHIGCPAYGRHRPGLRA